MGKNFILYFCDKNIEIGKKLNYDCLRIFGAGRSSGERRKKESLTAAIEQRTFSPSQPFQTLFCVSQSFDSSNSIFSQRTAELWKIEKERF
jgi:hypothetical protein